LGVGDSLDAPGTLAGPIAAGRWHLVGDVQVVGSGDVRYDFIWRPKSGGGDATLATFTHHFDPIPGSFDATLYDADTDGIAAAAVAGDQLIWRWTVLGGPDAGPPGTAVAIPNGNGTSSGGRYPFVTLP
jgi:hypothetical protein